ncbi:hypothetical protein [Arthrobacter sp. A2-55]|uniref:hypothetical protein n=1 Tax=Arthrobacter sp. A2-55 TaxID=2897337 RepID=UPI0021CDAF66|nr:hypothetical protein [Arthrobacter sp. A2-55]MCU6479007.1 hypothetical protein [Arthrobacter sp. A2-55]
MAVLSPVTVALARAAQEVPMAWLTQSRFPGRKPVVSAFRTAIELLPAPASTEHFALRQLRHDLQDIVDGPDPRGGTFKAQAIHVAGKLHDQAIRSMLQDHTRVD